MVKVCLLVAVASQRTRDLLFDTLVNRSRAAQISFSFCADSNVAVAGAGGAMHRFTVRTNAETFFCSLVGLHFVAHKSPDAIAVRVKDLNRGF